MKELSLNILDIAENSVKANATKVEIKLEEDSEILKFSISDNGCGMKPEFLKTVIDPFATTRTTRKVGLGIPMMAENCRLAGGDLKIESEVGKGTILKATMNTASIDCLPLGDIAGTVVTLVSANPEKPDFLLNCKSIKGEMTFDTRQVREVLDGVPLNEPEIVAWMDASIREEIEPIFGGVVL